MDAPARLRIIKAEQRYRAATLAREAAYHDYVVAQSMCDRALRERSAAIRAAAEDGAESSDIDQAVRLGRHTAGDGSATLLKVVIENGKPPQLETATFRSATELARWLLQRGFHPGMLENATFVRYDKRGVRRVTVENGPHWAQLVELELLRFTRPGGAAKPTTGDAD